MRKLFLSALAAIGLTTAANAQFEIGINFTPNSSHMLHKKHENTTNLVKTSKPFTFGYNVGATLTYHFSDAMSIVSGINYVAAGQRTKVTTGIAGITTTAESQVKLSYIRIPILLQFNNFGPGLYARIGPNLDFLTSEKITSGDQSYTLDGAYKAFTLGLTGEIGKAFQINDNLNFIAGLQLTGTLIDPVNKDNNNDEHYTSNFHIGINLGLNYSFGK